MTLLDVLRIRSHHHPMKRSSRYPYIQTRNLANTPFLDHYSSEDTSGYRQMSNRHTPLPSDNLDDKSRQCWRRKSECYFQKNPYFARNTFPLVVGQVLMGEVEQV
jgi:hypothetical protein